MNHRTDSISRDWTSEQWNQWSLVAEHSAALQVALEAVELHRHAVTDAFLALLHGSSAERAEMGALGFHVGDGSA